MRGAWFLDRIQAFGVDHQVRGHAGIPCQRLYEFFHLRLLWLRSLGEFHSHPNLWMHDPHNSLRPNLDFGGAHGQSECRLNWKGRRKFQIATTQAQVSQLAWYGWVVLFDLRRMAAQPCVELRLGIRRKVNETDSNLTPGIFPGYFSRTFQNVFGAREDKSHVHPIAALQARGLKKSDPTFPNIRGQGRLSASRALAG